MAYTWYIPTIYLVGPGVPGVCRGLGAAASATATPRAYHLGRDDKGAAPEREHEQP